MSNEPTKPSTPADPSPSEVVAQLKAQLAKATEQLKREKNFGPGLPGTIEFHVPEFPRDWHIGYIKTINAKGKKVFRGKMKLTHDEIEEFKARFNTRYKFEWEARHGPRGFELDLQKSGGSLF